MLEIGDRALRIISIHFPLAGFGIIAGSVCQAIGNPFYSLIISVCRQLVVLLPVLGHLAQTGRLDLVWTAFIIAEIVSATLSGFPAAHLPLRQSAFKQLMAVFAVFSRIPLLCILSLFDTMS